MNNTFILQFYPSPRKFFFKKYQARMFCFTIFGLNAYIILNQSNFNMFQHFRNRIMSDDYKFNCDRMRPGIFLDKYI